MPREASPVPRGLRSRPGRVGRGRRDIDERSSPLEEVAARQAFGRLIRELGIETTDLMPPMLAAKRSGRFERLTSAHDFHWNAAGNTVAAEVIATEIGRKGL